MSITSPRAKRAVHLSSSVLAGPGGPWHAGTPARVREAYAHSTDPHGWKVWQKHIATRRFCPRAKLLRGGGKALGWAMPDDLASGPTGELVNALAKVEKLSASQATALTAQADAWLEASASASAGAALGLECLAWCDALPRLTEHFPEALWWNLLNRLVEIAAEPVAIEADALGDQLLAGELRLALAYSFPELEPCRELAERGRATLSSGAAELLDGEGLIRAGDLSRLRPLLACWTRSKALGQELPNGCWDETAEGQFAGLVGHALRLSRPDGRQVFSAADSRPWNSDLLAAILRFADDRSTRRIARACAGKPPRNVRDKHWPAPSFEGSWAGIAMLRSDWSRSAPRLTVACHGHDLRIELGLGKKCLLSGLWDLDVRLGGQQMVQTSGWESICWESDEVDYLELETRLTHDSDELTVQRHILLAREDGFLLLADAILRNVDKTTGHGLDLAHSTDQNGTASRGDAVLSNAPKSPPRPIEYRGGLPLAESVEFEPAAETREGNLTLAGQSRARVLPLALPEWRTARCQGSLQQAGARLALSQATLEANLFVPLFIDFNRRRLDREPTWRQLTVAEHMQNVSPRVAAGYRVQVGRRQWLVYRSLAAPAVRTVLGKNLMHEFLVGRFNSQNGSVETLLEIE